MSEDGSVVSSGSGRNSGSKHGTGHVVASWTSYNGSCNPGVVDTDGVNASASYAVSSRRQK